MVTPFNTTFYVRMNERDTQKSSMLSSPEEIKFEIKTEDKVAVHHFLLFLLLTKESSL